MWKTSTTRSDITAIKYTIRDGKKNMDLYTKQKIKTRASREKQNIPEQGNN